MTQDSRPGADEKRRALRPSFFIYGVEMGGRISLTFTPIPDTYFFSSP